MMKRHYRLISIFTWRVSLALIFLGLSGCGVFATLNANRATYNKGNSIDRASDSEDQFLVDIADRFGLMALFAEVVYRRDLKDKEKDGQGCRYLDGKQASDYELNFGMPQDGDGQGRWRRWIPSPASNAAKPCVDESGLYYETYIYEDSDGKIEQAVIAFRGTENRRGQYLYDWSANVVAAFGFEPKQHALVRQQLPGLVDRLRERFDADGRAVKIYATGHSLGGGLAQEAGYLKAEIKEVFTFNTSPVTDWSYLRTQGAVKNGYPIFHRIYHGGEFLETPRFISTAFTQARYGRHDIGLQFTERKSVSGHSMSILACNFAELIASRPSNADGAHHYSVSYIRRAVKSPTLQVGKPVCSKEENPE